MIMITKATLENFKSIEEQTFDFTDFDLLFQVVNGKKLLFENEDCLSRRTCLDGCQLQNHKRTRGGAHETWSDP